MSLADELQRAETEKDEWHQKAQGPLIDILGQVWWCMDEECDCTQAQIVARFENLNMRARYGRLNTFIVPRTLWSGAFHTDGEPGANEELSAKRADLEANEPAIAVRILWPPVPGEHQEGGKANG